MSKLLQIGCSSAAELHEDLGHIACTLGGVNYECRGGHGCLRGSSARGADHRIFKHRYHLLLNEAQGAAAKRYADSCVGQRYDYPHVPSAHSGGDCSGYISGIICAAKGMKIQRLFRTATWPQTYARLGFTTGLGDGGLPPGANSIGLMDRGFPGRDIVQGSTATGHVRWIKARLNYAAHNHHPDLGGAALSDSGAFGPKTAAVVRTFQKHHGLDVDGKVGRNTWRALNAVR